MSAPAILTRLVEGRTYEVLGETLEYVGEVAGSHLFRNTRRSGTEQHSDAYVQELLSTGRLVPARRPRG